MTLLIKGQKQIRNGYYTRERIGHSPTWVRGAAKLQGQPVEHFFYHFVLAGSAAPRKPRLREPANYARFLRALLATRNRGEAPRKP
ncbi:hypothetical protein [Nitrospira sp. BLG_1]|uniref:hypothetical protein n=1 Tax=Nitrospira sp. BLG_1 TaxID=3395883 RepID=UPI0039BD336B